MTTWTGRSHAATLVHALHLLDLDELPDWPGVTEHSFDPKSSLQHRIRCAEWTLYRLIELHDARAARDKLKPFFPPSTFLQSVNLRAALLRQLIELKKDGVLSVMLRKSMLDECKGDKIEELLATFSIIVLKRTRASSRKKVKQENLVPLIISIRQSIQRDLKCRKELDVRARQQAHDLETANKAIQAEATELRRKRSPDLPEKAELLRDLLQKNWLADPAWSNVLMNGTMSNHVRNTTTNPQLGEDCGPLADLKIRLQEQDTRLQKWHTYLINLSSGSPDILPVAREIEPQRQEHLRFTRHKMLRSASEKDLTESQPALLPQHEALLRSLDEALITKRPIGQRDKRPVNGTTRFPILARQDGPATVQFVVSSLEPDELHANIRCNDLREEQPLAVEGDSGVLVNKHNPAISPEQSLLERTRASMARFETPKLKQRDSPDVDSKSSSRNPTTIVRAKSNAITDRVSLLERTRQSMSLLNNALEDSLNTKARSGPVRPTHTRSRTAVRITAQRPRLERAWSEESLASNAKEDSLDADADYESVFKSRPRLATSPNLSPQRIGDDLFFDEALQQSMDLLTMDSKPEP